MDFGYGGVLVLRTREQFPDDLSPLYCAAEFTLWGNAQQTKHGTGIKNATMYKHALYTCAPFVLLPVWRGWAVFGGVLHSTCIYARPMKGKPSLCTHVRHCDKCRPVRHLAQHSVRSSLRQVPTSETSVALHSVRAPLICSVPLHARSSPLTIYH